MEGRHLKVAVLLASQARADIDATNNEVSGFDMDELQMLTYRTLRIITAFHHDTHHMQLLQLVQDNVIKQVAFTKPKLGMSCIEPIHN